ncbi:MAG TPA: hypothetical protein VFA35_07130 [Burkholderiaceae bacterium]|nr:hypothetical protein [Burkholderiaceae bacterium]
MELWRLRATNTHLYPGAALAFAGKEAASAALGPGDQVLVEFADQGVAQGIVVGGGVGDPAVVQFGAHLTAKGTTVQPARWVLVRSADGLRVKRRES